jgi:ABC-type antimicrobial peptide transport system permease subunit
LRFTSVGDQCQFLVSIGIYGVVSYSVAARSHGYGVRMTLGAKQEDILELIGGQGFRLALVGVTIVVLGALAFTGFLSSLLYGVNPTDPSTILVVSLLLIVVALIASYIPARRAMRVDPSVALRHE